MMNIYDLQQRAEVLRKRNIEGSITPEEVGGLIADTLSLISSIEQNSSSLAVVKVYSSVAAMQGDASPVAMISLCALGKSSACTMKQMQMMLTMAKYMSLKVQDGS